jgi:hypothetical protein
VEVDAVVFVSWAEGLGLLGDSQWLCVYRSAACSVCGTAS